MCAVSLHASLLLLCYVVVADAAHVLGVWGNEMMIVAQRQRNVGTRDAQTKLPGVEGAMHTTSYFTGGKRTRWREQ